MNNELRYCILYIISIFTILYIIKLWGKRVRKAVQFQIFFTILVGTIIAAISCEILFEDYAYDKYGIAYELDDQYLDPYQVIQYYTPNGDIYHVEDNKMININNKNEVYELNQCFLNKDGYLLILNSDKKYVSTTKSSSIYRYNDEQYIYRLEKCYWTFWKEFIPPELVGCNIGRLYLHRLPIDDNLDIRYTLASIIFISMFIYILVYTQRQKKMCSNTVYAHFFASGWCLLCCLLAARHNLNISAFISIIVIITAYTTVWYFEGLMEIETRIVEATEQAGVHRSIVEKEMFPCGIFLKDVMENAQISRVKKWRKIILVWLLSEQFIWLFFAIVYTIWFGN